MRDEADLREPVLGGLLFGHERQVAAGVEHGALVCLKCACREEEERGLPGAGRTLEGQCLAGLEGEGNAIDRVDVLVASVVALDDPGELEHRPMLLHGAAQCNHWRELGGSRPA